MNRFSYILFDLDGTLTDPGEGITNSVRYALRHFGIEEPDITKLYRFIGPPLKNSFMKQYDFEETKAELAIKKYREYFSEKGIYENKLYPGISHMLAQLTERGKQIVLATSKPAVFARKILAHFSISSYFSQIAGSELNGERTEKKEVIAHALSLCGLEEGRRSEVIMVGDRKYDITGAHDNGVEALGVLYGYGSREEMEAAQPQYLVNSVEELCALLCR